MFKKWEVVLDGFGKELLQWTGVLELYWKDERLLRGSEVRYAN